MIRVFKFGGASVKDTEALKNACKILQDHSQSGPVLLVVSAMGKMTNAFEELHKCWFGGNDTSASMETIRTYHDSIIEILFEKNHPVRLDAEVLYSDIQKIISHPAPHDGFDQTYDSIVPFGELFSSCILYHFVVSQGLNASLINAADHIYADDLWREGRIHWKKTEDAIKTNILPLLNQSPDKIIITQGFIARSSENTMITLGREGSDFSASIFAYCLDAKSITIWKDVPGLFNADPKSFDKVTLIPHLSYHEAVELAYYGQSIIHPKTIKPLQNKKIPLHIRSFVNPNLQGSIIDDSTEHDTEVPCFILKKNQMLVSVSPRDFAFINEHNLGEIIGHLAEIRIRMNVMQNSAISFSFCADFSNYKLNRLIEQLQPKYSVKYNTNLELITIRNYNDQIISKLTIERKILLEQRSRSTVQLVTGFKSKN